MTEAGSALPLEEYVKRMPRHRRTLLRDCRRPPDRRNSPRSRFPQQGYECFHDGPIDEWIVNDHRYVQKRSWSDQQSDVDLDSEEEKEAKEESAKKAAEENKDMMVPALAKLLKRKSQGSTVFPNVGPRVRLC